ncbi:TetR family transcriptional regulator [Citricoccus sp. GCM10030269]|uniref:TetR/AcrR family transcriptional regulator n=1 Tax=Citricoccus sp. GCM10030269 TaxID=3273388 RepID=UPI003620EE1A
MRRTSAETKTIIRAAARERFAREGYDRTTIRAIAQDASIDPSMVMRYFGSKEGLFAEAVDLDLRLPEVSEIPAADRGAALAGHFVDRWEDGDELLMILLRTAATNPAAAERMRSVFADQLTPVVARLTGEPSEAPLRAGLIATQVLGLALCRYTLDLPPVVQMSREQIIDLVGPTLQRYLSR